MFSCGVEDKVDKAVSKAYQADIALYDDHLLMPLSVHLSDQQDAYSLSGLRSPSSGFDFEMTLLKSIKEPHQDDCNT